VNAWSASFLRPAADGSWVPKVRVGLSRKQLQELGAKLEQAWKKAPRSPAQPSALKKTIDAVIA
jgi:hypothetical protein